MTSRERVLTAVARREADRVPFNLRPSRAAVERLRQETGSSDFAEHFGHDVRYVRVALPARPADVPEAEWTPAPEAQAVAQAAADTAALHERGLAVCGQYACGVFEQAKHWLGDAETLTAPYDDPRGFVALLERIAAWKASVYGAYAEAGTDLVWMGDDLGAQRSLVMSPEHYRQWYRPLHRQIVEHIRSRQSGVKVVFHCCGHVTPLIGDLIEIGVDVLEAVQPEAMDLAQLKREFGRDIAFWGGVGEQSVLDRATREQIMTGVRDTLNTMASGGGYIVAPCHSITEEVPWETVLAFHDAVAAYGAYPRPVSR